MTLQLEAAVSLMFPQLNVWKMKAEEEGADTAAHKKNTQILNP